METCVAAAEAAARTATNAANTAADAAAAVIADGCAAARTALERDVAVALEALGEEVTRAAQARPGGWHGVHDDQWGGMWGRLDEMIHGCLQRCLQARSGMW
eukprot:2445226-Prymnesium_polylepis.1